MQKRWIAAVIACLVSTSLSAEAQQPTTQRTDTLWIIPHTHWEGAVFKTREEYLDVGLKNILHALEILRQNPDYTFVLDQAAYVKPFMERYPEQAALFKQFVKEGRLELVLGMDVMPDVSKPGGETFIRQIQYGKGYYRREFGKDVKIAWLLDTFGHHAQMPQLLKLGGYSSFWFFRGVPRQNFPSEFIWQGIDGTRIQAFWEPYGYGDFYRAPSKLPEFERFARQRFSALDANAKGHDRVVYAGADVVDPQEHLPDMVRQAEQSGRLPFHIRFGVPSQFEAAVRQRTDLPVFDGDLNPIFQGTYSSRIEIKQWMREEERLLTAAEKLGAINASASHSSEAETISRAWEPVLFNETHDLASGVMTDHVYEDTMRSYEFSKRLAESSITRSLNELSDRVDTSGQGAAIVVFNPLSWSRTEPVEVTLGSTQTGHRGIRIVGPDGQATAVQLLDAVRYRDGSLLQARVAFLARNIPPLGYAVFHATGEQDEGELNPSAPSDDVLENARYRVELDTRNGQIRQIVLKEDQWKALSAPANGITRQADHGDLWELYHGLDGGSRIAMTARQPLPVHGTDLFTADCTGERGEIKAGSVYSEFSVSHPFDTGSFATTIRLAKDSDKIEITTRLVNNTKYVRYQAQFPTAIENGHGTMSIPFGAIERPTDIEFPAQDWVDWGDPAHGVAVLNIGLPGNVFAGPTILVSLLRSHTLGAYGYGGGYERGMSSDGGYELGQERTLHYALMPHAGDWRQAHVWRAGLELNHPLLVHKTTSHPGKLPARWTFLEVSNFDVVISSVQPGRQNDTVLVRLYEAAGQPINGVVMDCAFSIQQAAEVNFLGDHLAELKPDQRTLRFDLGPYQIKTFELTLAR